MGKAGYAAIGMQDANASRHSECSASAGLALQDQGLTGEEQVRRQALALRIYKAKTVELSADEIKLICDQIAKVHYRGIATLRAWQSSLIRSGSNSPHVEQKRSGELRMSEDEVLRMVAKLREDVSGPLKRIELGLRGVGKRGAQELKALRDGFRKVQDEFRGSLRSPRSALTPAFEAIGLSSLTAVGAVAALTAGLKNFADQGADVAAFGRRVQLTADTIRGLEGVAEKFQVDPNAIRQAEQSLADLMFGVRRHAGQPMVC